ncbi:MAG: hypothetical protein KKA60_13120 [Proteobacteria bacterium]|nr:hypothetical protein [Pseudomonadota bacterium]
MKSDNSKFLEGILIIIVLFGGIYLIFSYDKLFDRRIAYLYNPDNDDIYRIELGPYLYSQNKWDIFIPFKSLEFIVPDGIEYAGKLHAEIENSHNDMDMLRNNPDEWHQKKLQEIKELASDFSQEHLEFEILDVSYNVCPIQNARELVPDTIFDIFNNDTLGINDKINQKDILVVDFVISLRIFNLNSQGPNNPASISVVRRGLLFKEAAAYLLSMNGL